MSSGKLSSLLLWRATIFSDSLLDHVLRLNRLGPDHLRSDLLQLTLAEALKAEFYRKIWSGIDIPNVTLASIANLPIINKAAIQSAGADAQIRNGMFCDEVFTMGTSGPPLVTIRGSQEQSFIAAYFTALNLPNTVDGKRVRIMKFTDPYHGYHVKVPARVHCHRVSIYDAGSFEHARKTLQNTFEDHMVQKRCTVLMGGRCLKAFSLDTFNKYGEKFETSLERIITVGDYLSRYWRSLMQQTWKAPIADHYSVSEIFGGASQTFRCGWWHFVPYVIPEVISQKSRKPIKEGLGILVLTALYPFQEAQPLVRYSTGDLVEVTHSQSSRDGELAIKPMGRAAYGVPHPENDEWLVTPASLLEILEEMPVIARKPLYRDAEQVQDPEAVGLPLYNISSRHFHEQVFISISVVTKNLESSQTKTIEEQIIEGLKRQNPVLARELDKRRATVEIHIAPSLSGTDIARPE